jgi:hypothetical protein
MRAAKIHISEVFGGVIPFKSAPVLSWNQAFSCRPRGFRRDRCGVIGVFRVNGLVWLGIPHSYFSLSANTGVWLNICCILKSDRNAALTVTTPKNIVTARAASAIKA